MAARDFEEYIQRIYTLLLLYYCFTTALLTRWILKAASDFFESTGPNSLLAPLPLQSVTPPPTPLKERLLLCLPETGDVLLVLISHFRCSVRICTFVLLKQVLLYY